jgi:hypothetical protein
VLDDAYAAAFGHCLAQGFWNFAMRAVKLDPTPAMDPAFGYQFAFEKPSDWVRTYQVSAEPTFTVPLLHFSDEAGVWYANVDPLYVRYVSSDVSIGGDLSRWPQLYADYVALRVAHLSSLRIEAAADLHDGLLIREKNALISARAKDGMDQPPAFPPRGTWAGARGASTFSRNGR